MPEHEMQAAEVDDELVEQDVQNKKSLEAVDPDKVNLDLGFGPPLGDEKPGQVERHHDSENSASDTPDDEEPNDVEKRTLRRGWSLLLWHEDFINIP
jgi:hypothetical protein